MAEKENDLTRASFSLDQPTSCKSADDWLSVTRSLEAKLQGTSAIHRCEQLSAVYCQAFQWLKQNGEDLSSNNAFAHLLLNYAALVASNPSNTNGVNEARKILAIALKEASLVPDIYLTTIDFEIAHGNVDAARRVLKCAAELKVLNSEQIMSLSGSLVEDCSGNLRNGVYDVSKLVSRPSLTSSCRQALSDVTPRVLYQQALNGATPRCVNSLVSAVASDTSVGSISSTSHGRAVGVYGKARRVPAKPPTLIDCDSGDADCTMNEIYGVKKAVDNNKMDWKTDSTHSNSDLPACNGDVHASSSAVRNETTTPHVTLPCRTTSVVKSGLVTKNYSTYTDCQSLSAVSRSLSLPVGDLLLGQHQTEQSTDSRRVGRPRRVPVMLQTTDVDAECHREDDENCSLRGEMFQSSSSGYNESSTLTEQLTSEASSLMTRERNRTSSSVLLTSVAKPTVVESLPTSVSITDIKDSISLTVPPISFSHVTDGASLKASLHASQQYESNSSCASSSSSCSHHSVCLHSSQTLPLADVVAYSSRPLLPNQTVPFKDCRTQLINGKPYVLLSVIGRGGSSKVYEALGPDMKLCAVKCVDIDVADEQSYRNEISLLQRLQHCSEIVRLYDHMFDYQMSVLYVVLERGEVDLSVFFRTSKTRPDVLQSLINPCWRQMLYAVQALHQQGIIHSDLKPANFILAGGVVKLIDFGIAKAIQPDRTSVTCDQIVGTFSYMSPEAISDLNGGVDNAIPNIKISTKSDVWSLGCILYSLVYNRTPFESIRAPLLKLQAIMNPAHEIEFPDTQNPHVVDLLKKCLDRNPRSRPTVDELLKHPYTEGRL